MKKHIRIGVILVVVLIIAVALINRWNNAYTNQVRSLTFEEDKYIFKVGKLNPDQINDYQVVEKRVANETDDKLQEDLLAVYYQEDELLVSVELVSYLEMMEPQLNEETTVKFNEETEIWEIANKTENEYVQYDFKRNIIKISSVSGVSSLFKTSEIATGIKQYYQKTQTEIQAPQELIIDLNEYDLNMQRIDSTFLIPMELLNVSLLPNNRAMIYNGKQYTYINTDQSNERLKDELRDLTNTQQFSEQYQTYSEQIIRLYMEKFYAFGSIKLLPTLVVDQNNTQQFIDKMIELQDPNVEMIIDLFTPLPEQTDLEIETWLAATKENGRIGCGLEKDREQVETYQLSKQTFVLEINGFNSKFLPQYAEAIKKAKKYENIVLDLKCAGGVELDNMVMLFYPLMDDNITINYTDNKYKKVSNVYEKIIVEQPQTSETESEEAEYQDDAEVLFEYLQGEVIDQQLYLVTSPKTSGAGVMAASLFREHRLGQIIGEKTGGQTSATRVIELPNGMVMEVPWASTMLTDKDFNSIEVGIVPDISYEMDVERFRADIKQIIEKSD